jgi:hypothetical protein
MGLRVLRPVSFPHHAAGDSQPLRAEVLPLRKSCPVWLPAGFVCLLACSVSALAQDTGTFGGRQSFGLSATYSGDSSHILIGESEQRRIWTAGVEYTRLIHQNPLFRLDYEGSILPIFEETDPTVIGTSFTSSGQTIVTSQPPVRVVSVVNGPVGTILSASGAFVPLYAMFGKQNTYAAAITPVGARISAMPHWRLQPSLALDTGFVFSSRDIPVGDSARFNYLLAFGPGLQFFGDNNISWRVEYLYRHLSNASQGDQNPGIDQGVIRLTVSLHR